jgi:hypothetical protein
VATSRTMRDVLVALGLAPYGGNYETIRNRIRYLGLDASHLRTFRRGRGVRDCSDEDIAKAVRQSRSLAQVLSRLGLRPGGNQGRLKTRIMELGLDTSHLLGRGWRRGNRTPVIRRRPLEEYLVQGRLVHTGDIKKRLIEEGLKAPRCEICRRGSWNGTPIPLELDHVNGRRDDNRLSNLRILCPNCHAQTSTYRGRNIGIRQSVS